MIEQRKKTKIHSSISIDMNKFNLFILYMFPLIDVKLYGFAFINSQIMKGVLFAVIPMMVLYCFNTIIKQRDKLTLDVRNIMIVLCISLLMALFFHDQSILFTYRSSCNFFCFIFYFFLIKANLSEKHIVRCVFLYGILWIVIWGVSMYYAPIPIFGSMDEDLYEIRGTYRFFIPGDAFLYMMFYYSIGKCVIRKNKLFILLAILLGIVIVYQVTRQTIVTCIIITLYYILRKVKYIVIYLIAILFIFAFASINLSKIAIIGNMINLSEEQMNAQRKGELDTRLYDYKYFFTEFENNPLTIVLGNGMPHDDSEYGKKFLRLKEEKFVFLSDVGYPSIYILFGVLGLILFARLFYHITKFKYITKDLLWVKMYLMHIMICNFASFHISTNIVGICLALYLFSKRRRYIRFVRKKLRKPKISQIDCKELDNEERDHNNNVCLITE